MPYNNGAGTSPMGVGPYGIGTPIQGPIEGGIVYNNGSRGQTGSRWLNSNTRQYVFNSDGLIAGMPDVAQLVQLAVTTRLNSSAIGGLGLDLSRLTTVTPNIEKQVKELLIVACKDLINNKLIEVVGVTVKLNAPSQLLVQFQWRDLTTKTVNTIELT